MSSVVCDCCSEYIEVANLRFPGFCSEMCRDDYRLQRDRDASNLAQRRADARQHHAATARGPFGHGFV